MTGEFLVCRLGEFQSIPNADKIVKVEMYGETIVTQNTNNSGDLGILFDCETQLSPEFCRINDLYDDESLNVTAGTKGYISSKNRRVRPITLKGVKVSAMWMPIKCIRYCFDSYAKFSEFCANSENKHFKAIGDIQICDKYVTPETQRSSAGAYPNGFKKHSKIKDRCPNFKKHFDTQHWGKAKVNFDYPYTAIITEKLHGTSLRVGYHPVKHEKKWWQKLLFWKKYSEKYSIVVGTRNTIKTYDLDNCHLNDDLYIKAARYILSYVTLAKDETLYCEIVGYDGTKPIMPSHNNIKLKGHITSEDYKKITKEYGDTTTYSYGCSVGNFEVYIYRRTVKDVEVSMVDTWQKNPPPTIKVMHIYSDDMLEELKKDVNIATSYFSSAIGKHIKEGVCIRLEKDSQAQVFKNKSFIFKVLEGIAKDSDTYTDIEEIN